MVASPLPLATPDPKQRIAMPHIVRAGVLGAALSSIANAAIFFLVVQGFGVQDDALNTVISPVVLSALGALGATAVFAVGQQRARQPIRTFRRIAFWVLLVSFVPDFFATGATTAWGVPTLMVMHVVSAIIMVGLLTGWRR